MKSLIQTTREAVAKALSSYGEDEAARQIVSLSEQDYLLIQERAFTYACTPDSPSGRGMLLAKALSKAAVEIIEGQPRELKRKKRKAEPSGSVGSWPTTDVR